MGKIAVVPDKLWLKAYCGKWWLTLGFQHRIADPPALEQTCHHSILLRNGIHLSKEII